MVPIVVSRAGRRQEEALVFGCHVTVKLLDATSCALIWVTTSSIVTRIIEEKLCDGFSRKHGLGGLVIPNQCL